WTFATGLAQGLAEQGMEVVLATLGPRPDEAQEKAARAIPGLTLEVTDLALEWMDPEGGDRARAARALRALEYRFRPDIVHLNGYREAAVGWFAPVVVTAHSCVGTWWRACRSGAPTAEWRTY